MSRGTTVTINGKDYTLRFNLNAVAEIGDRLGLEIRLAHINEDLLERPLPLRAPRTILWAGLLHENKDLTEEEVGDMFDVEDLQEIMQGFFDLWQGTSTPEEQEEGEASSQSETSEKSDVRMRTIATG